MAENKNKESKVEQVKENKSAEAVSSTPAGANPDFLEAYKLENQRVADVQDAQTADENSNITDGQAVKTDGSANVNADKGIPSTPAQMDESPVNEDPSNPVNFQKTEAEMLGTANPDDRLAALLREAKLNPDTSEFSNPEIPSFIKDGKDTRTDDITLPDGQQKAQDKKDIEAAINFHKQEIERLEARRLTMV